MKESQLRKKILNSSSFRKGIAENIPLFKRLEDSDFLKNLKLTSLKVENLIQANYEAIASSEIYPYTRSRLIEKGVIKRSEVGATRKKDQFGNLRDYEELCLYSNGASVQIWLKIFNPDYNKNQKNKESSDV